MNNLRWLFVAALLLASIKVGLAVPPDVNLTRTYDVRGYFSQIVLADSTAYPQAFLGGNALEGQFQFWAQRVDSAGDTVWTDRLGSTDQLYGMIRSSAGNQLVLVGSTYESGSMDNRHIRLGLGGAVEVDVDDGSSQADERLSALCRSPGGGEAVEYALSEVRPGAGGRDVVAHRLSANGSIDGNRLYAGAVSATTLLSYRTAQNIPRLIGAGTADSIESRNTDFWFLRTDTTFADSNDIERRFGGSLADICNDAVRLSAQLTILVGTTRSFGDSIKGDIWIVATNDNGDSLWSRKWRSSGVDVAYGVAVTMDYDTGFVIAGYTRAADTLAPRGILAKYNRQGDSLWTLFVDAAQGVVLYDVVQDGGYHFRTVGGVTTAQGQHGFYAVTDADPHSPGQHPPNRFSLLYPLESDTVTNDTVFFDWEDAIEPDGETVRYGLILDSDTLFQAPLLAYGPLFVSRYTWAGDSDETRIYWRVVAQDDHNLTRICEQRSGSFLRLIPDSTSPFNLAYPDSGVALTQPFSEFRWFPATDPDLGDHVTYSVHFQTVDTTVAFPSISDTFMTVSFANNPIFPEVSPVTWWVTASSNFPVMDRQSRQHWRFVTWSADAEDRSLVPLEFGLTRVYPNPFNARVTLEFALEQAGNAELRIYDLEGRLVETVVRGFMTAGQYRMSWNGASHASGIYFARLTSDSQMATVKLTLLK